MLSQTVAREVRAELGRQSITRKTFAERASLPYKKALDMIDRDRPWTLEDVEAAAGALGTEPLDLLYPARKEVVAA